MIELFKDFFNHLYYFIRFLNHNEIHVDVIKTI